MHAFSDNVVRMKSISNQNGMIFSAFSLLFNIRSTDDDSGFDSALEPVDNEDDPNSFVESLSVEQTRVKPSEKASNPLGQIQRKYKRFPRSAGSRFESELFNRKSQERKIREQPIKIAR